MHVQTKQIFWEIHHYLFKIKHDTEQFIEWRNIYKIHESLN